MTDDAILVSAFLGIGREKAMTRATLCALTGLSDRKVRAAIESAKRAETGDDEYFIVDEGDGYFKTDDKVVIRRHWKREHSRAIASHKRSSGEYHYLKKAGRL